MGLYRLGHREGKGLNDQSIRRMRVFESAKAFSEVYDVSPVEQAK